MLASTKLRTTWGDPVDSYDQEINTVTDNGLRACNAVVPRLDVADELAKRLDARARRLVSAEDIREGDSVLLRQLLERRRALRRADELQCVLVRLGGGMLRKVRVERFARLAEQVDLLLQRLEDWLDRSVPEGYCRLVIVAGVELRASITRVAFWQDDQASLN